MPKILKFLLIFCFAIIVKFAYSQEYKSLPILQNKIHTGLVINNYIYMDSFPLRKISFINEFYLGAKTRGNKFWHQYYNFPEIGVSIFTGTLGNKRQLGNILGIVPSIAFDIVKKNNYNLKFSVGLGFAYFNTPFDSITNEYNILIGSNITGLAFITMTYHKDISQQLKLLFGISYIHASNGHYQVPNAGMNIMAGDIGLHYYFNQEKENVKKNNSYFPKKVVNLNLKFGIGVHEYANTIGPVGTPKHKIYTGSVFLSKRFSNVNKVFSGFSGKYYTDFYNFIDTSSFYTDKYHLKSSIFTFFLGHEFILGQVGFFAQGGINFYTPLIKDRLYQNTEKMKFFHITELYISTRLGFKFYLLNLEKHPHNNIFIATSIKANFGKADFPEISIAYVF